MISARFLAEMDMRLRAAARAIGTMKYDDRQQERPFGGLNVIFAGDFYQLNPPEPGGWSLSRIPTSFYDGSPASTPAPTSEYGLLLFWGDDQRQALTGLTELVHQERCVDAWYNLLLDECREGRLSEHNHQFLHGQPTAVPGSWMAAGETPRTLCKEAACMALVDMGASCQEIVKKECKVCKRERARRARVARGSHDSRFVREMRSAALIVPNNDVKMHTNKQRAKLFAAQSGAQLVWVPAKDVASSEVMREDPLEAANKLQWLKRHDRESGDVYGMLPICFQMPVVLTDHLDRSRDKNLLRGTRGTIVSWVLHAEDESEARQGLGAERVLSKQPIVVFVKFNDAEWKLPGVDEVGVYPVRSVVRDWYLDRNRKYPKLKVKRHQLPLAPGFAMAAHASQGATLHKSHC